MLGFLALVVAVIALVVAQNAKREAAALRKLIAPSAPVPVATTAPPPTPSVAPPPLPSPPPPVAAPVRPRAARTWNIDWENLVGIKLFGWIAGIALVLAAVFLFKYSVEHGWLRPAVRAAFGLISGVALLVVCELRVANNYRFTANAMHGAGIAILYATLFALHEQWHLWPAPVVFVGMILVTAAAVFLSTRRDSVFIALLGLLGGFATPALLSSGENRPVALFSYLLLLNGGISWIAWKKRWPLLTALSVALTAFYQWSWVERFLSAAQLPLAAAIFFLFAVVAAGSFWATGELPFRRIAAAGAVLPLLFAFFTAIVPEYGARTNVLFGFLLLVTAGLAAIAMWRGPEWLHTLGGAATLLTFFIWLVVSYNSTSWPWSVVWLAAFTALYLVRPKSIALYAAPLLFFVFIGVAVREPARSVTLIGAMLALLAIVVILLTRYGKPYAAAIALSFASIALMAMEHAPSWLIITAHALVIAALLGVTWMSKRTPLAFVATALFLAACVTAADDDQLILAGVLYALFIAYSFASRTNIAASIASAIAFGVAYVRRDDYTYDAYIGAIPLAQSLVLLALRARHVAIAFFSLAIFVQLHKQWITIAWAIEGALLAALRKGEIFYWSVALAIASLVRLAMTPRLDAYHYTYTICAFATFIAAALAPPIRTIATSIATIELFMLLNVAIDKFYDQRVSSPLAQDLTYTIGWALFALTMLVAGIALHDRGARIAALALLLVTILKCFLHDLARLGGLYRVGSLFGLAVSLVLVGLMLQKFVMMKRTESESSP